MILFVIMNEVYIIFFWKNDIEKTCSYLNILKNLEKESDILYLGESSNFTTDPSDQYNYSISEFIASYYSDVHLGTVNYSAIHAGIYNKLIRHISTDSPVKTLIITMNLRSFNADWIYSELETLLKRDMVMLSEKPPLMNRFLIGLKAYENKSKEERIQQVLKIWQNEILRFPYPFRYKNVHEWDSAVANGSFLKPDGSWDMEKIQLATSYVKTYAFQIDTNTNPRIHDFDEIVRYAKKRNWNLVFNLMAENTEKTGELCGKDLLYLIRQNRDLLKERYNKDGVIVVDNLELVPDQYYIDKNWTTEHYTEPGRRIVAKNVAVAIQKLYPGKYKEHNTLSNLNNDFEKKSGWFSEGNISTEKSKSGKHSCLVSGDSPYSATWSSLAANFASCQYVDANVWYYADEPVKEGKLVISFEKPDGQSIEWNGKGLAEISVQGKDWNQAKMQVKIPALNPGDIIKVYLWSPAGEKIFIDDFSLQIY